MMQQVIPVIGLVLSTRHEGVQDITLSDWKDNGDGSYTPRS